MKLHYRNWLEEQHYSSGTITSQIHRIERVEKHHGDLDRHFESDQMAAILAVLHYSTSDERRGAPNPTNLPIDGNLRTNIASYRNAVKLYRTYLVGGNPSLTDDADLDERSQTEEDGGQKIGLERDMQAALRQGITQLEEGLVIIDGGAERRVESGFIDITARDAGGSIVVIELKAGAAGPHAVTQILSYMGDLVEEDESESVRGILVAHEFDGKARAAARVVPSLSLRRYSVKFTFSDGHS